MGRDRGDGEESGPVRGQQMSQLPEGRVGELDALDARHGTLLRGTAHYCAAWYRAAPTFTWRAAACHSFCMQG
jgi:hypothetical protein